MGLNDFSCLIQKEYEIVTNDYERAKSLFAGTKVKVFSKGTCKYDIPFLLDVDACG